MKKVLFIAICFILANLSFSQDTLIIKKGRKIYIGKDYTDPINTEYRYKPFYKTIIFEPYSTLFIYTDVEQLYLASDNVIVNGPCQIIVLRNSVVTHRYYIPGTNGAAGPKGDHGENGAELNFNFTFTTLNGPIFIDNIGTSGYQGCQGSSGKKGRNADCYNYAAGRGSPGGAGGDGGDGGNGGKINLQYFFPTRVNTEELSSNSRSAFINYWEYMTKKKQEIIGVNIDLKNYKDTTYSYVKLSKKKIKFDEIPILNGTSFNADACDEIAFIDTAHIPNKYVTLKGYEIIKVNGTKTIVFDTNYFKTSWSTNDMKAGQTIDKFLSLILSGTSEIMVKPKMFNNPGVYYYIEPGEGGSPGNGGVGGPGGDGKQCNGYQRGPGENGNPGPSGKRKGERGLRFTPSFTWRH